MMNDENVDYESTQSEVIVANTIDYSTYFENIQNGCLFIILVLIAGFLSLSLQIGLKK